MRIRLLTVIIISGTSLRISLQQIYIKGCQYRDNDPGLEIMSQKNQLQVKSQYNRNNISILPACSPRNCTGMLFTMILLAIHFLSIIKQNDTKTSTKQLLTVPIKAEVKVHVLH